MRFINLAFYHLPLALALKKFFRGAGLSIVLACMGFHATAALPEGRSFVYDAKGQLVRSIDTTGTVLEYIYDETGNLLEIRRMTLNGLAIIGFAPSTGPAGATVTIQGQGFSPTPAANDVRFNGAAASVLSASPSLLTVTVPLAASTGPITVTAGGETATSSEIFTVVASPVITAVAPLLVLSASGAPTASSLQVTGINLTGSTFTLVPEIVPPPLTVNSTTINPSGTSAALGITVAAKAAGSFTLVATNGVGSSSAFPSPSNTITFLEGALDPDSDGLTNAQEVALGTNPFQADTDGDGFLDGNEIEGGSNPLDPLSRPVSATYAVISILNRTDPAAAQGAFFGFPISVFNTTAPQGYATGPDVSVSNVPP